MAAPFGKSQAPMAGNGPDHVLFVGEKTVSESGLNKKTGGGGAVGVERPGTRLTGFESAGA
jgi:hypothetical protein